jgi:ABC-type tungstate transport system permease subunit
MKKTIFKIATILLALQLFSATACKNEVKDQPTTTSQDTKETSLEQEPKMLKNEKGETLKVIYFANGDEVAAKITKDGKEHILKAKGTNNKGEPFFTDDTFAWEIMESGTSGRLTDKSGKFEVYKPEVEQ